MKTLFIFGTRPEAIKLAPVIKAFDEHYLTTIVCSVGQHKEMLDQVLEFYNIKVDYDLGIMKENQSLFDVTVECLKNLERVLVDCKPDLVVVQGDTTSAFVGSLAAFYMNCKVVHVEAGLRSNNKRSPFPEEMNRVLIGQIADLHFAPTDKARTNLLNENIDSDSIHVVGNTGIDSLLICNDLVRSKNSVYEKKFAFLRRDKRIILVTGHRRESFGDPFADICCAIKEIAQANDVEVVYPVHLNPNVRKQVWTYLEGLSNVHLIDPVDYPSLVWLLSKSYLVITDSGGIQEEAPSLGKPVMVIRDVTERTEGVEVGVSILVGTKKENIIKYANMLLNDEGVYKKMSAIKNPYGDGASSRRIVEIVSKKYC